MNQPTSPEAELVQETPPATPSIEAPSSVSYWSGSNSGTPIRKDKLTRTSEAIAMALPPVIAAAIGTISVREAIKRTKTGIALATRAAPANAAAIDLEVTPGIALLGYLKLFARLSLAGVSLAVGIVFLATVAVATAAVMLVPLSIMTMRAWRAARLKAQQRKQNTATSSGQWPGRERNKR